MATDIREEPFSGWEALAIAAGIEERGIRFYRAAAAATTEPTAKTVFEAMIGEEHRHLATVEEALVAARGLTPVEEGVVRTYLAGVDGDLDPFTFVAAHSDGGAALAAAHRVEQVAARNYLDLARRSMDLQAKAVLVALAEEELSHDHLLTARLGGPPLPLAPETGHEQVARLTVLEAEIRRSMPSLGRVAQQSGLTPPLPTQEGSVFTQIERLRHLLLEAEEELNDHLDGRIQGLAVALQPLGA
ncbi:MAG: hypothetical protein COW73_07270 [Nitrospirae bacterium CG18_big_fil_WC_8_21_14_2_50_70_55]|nr:ferritin family protein [Deltaproteobacteria bacterium]OIP65594.1 MAG: hypothetical protein AUK30_04440 [Nitrospirae bacterium CG2_30_70_394]PIQ04769.1 MAG: hypothetical protein COW73_07270 [Nitrospirae bacterium CG18_big_fil_WC_8_21_14_2_50_70_55]PIU78209.1 MAG: hypothetical protein COS73_07860 [Nitrospirae bacterium CG06_land_8_20_14_3_00_70_43]PIW82214.1 MAG: hypothetical protein COZ96_09810 [Nitrospirae bacterium CG_4_8_14_3_um_filter_70_85]PIX83244.1 MAG: hypothetical protein COZ33_064